MESNRAIKILILGILVASAVFGGYFLVKKIQHDRQAALAYTPHTPLTTITQRKKDGTTETHTYTREELDEMRKKGKSPNGVKQPFTPQPINNAGQAAAERAQRTLEEINRINAMNQRLM